MVMTRLCSFSWAVESGLDWVKALVVLGNVGTHEFRNAGERVMMLNDMSEFDLDAVPEVNQGEERLLSFEEKVECQQDKNQGMSFFGQFEMLGEKHNQETPSVNADV